MIDKIHDLRNRVAQYREKASLVSTMILVFLLLSSTLAIAQVGVETWSDDFEDGSTEGWVHDTSGWPKIATENGNESLYVRTTATDETRAEWEGGPKLNLSEEFTVNGTFKGIHEGTKFPIRIGIFGPNTSSSATDNALLIFDKPNGVTYLSSQEVPDSIPAQNISTSFNNTWVNYEIYSPADDNTIKAKVWQVGTSEPQSYQLEQSFDPTSGLFGVGPGSNDAHRRHAYLDDVQIEGTEQTDPDLAIETKTLLKHGENQTYSVWYEEFSQEYHGNVSKNVTKDANVTSLDTDGITVNQTNNRLIATNNDTYAQRVDIRAEYNGSVSYTYVTVAEVNMQNLAILPPWYRIGATLGDNTIFLFIIAILSGIAGTRLSTSFGGISMMEMTVVIGWLAGYVSDGLVMVSVFMAMFIGLNLAANIDYQVQR